MAGEKRLPRGPVFRAVTSRLHLDPRGWKVVYDCAERLPVARIPPLFHP